MWGASGAALHLDPAERLQDDAAHSVSLEGGVLEDGVAHADDVLPTLVLVAGVEVLDLLCEGHLAQ